MYNNCYLVLKHRWSFGIVLYEIFTIGMFQCCFVAQFFSNLQIAVKKYFLLS